MQAAALSAGTQTAMRRRKRAPLAPGTLSELSRTLGMSLSEALDFLASFGLECPISYDDYLAGVKRLATNRECIDTMDPSAPKTLEKMQLGEFDIGPGCLRAPLGYWVPSSPMPRPALPEPDHGQPTPPDHAVLRQRIHGVLTTRRREPARRQSQRRDGVAVELDEEDQRPDRKVRHRAFSIRS